VCRHESGRVGVEEVRGEVTVEMKEEEEESHLESALAILIKEVFIIFDLKSTIIVYIFPRSN